MRRFLVPVVVLALAAAGCRSSDVATTSTTTTLATTTTTAAVSEFPVEVETDLGPVEVAQPPQRIVSLSATHTEMLYAVGAGDQVIATDLTSNHPPAAAETVKLDSFNFSAEEVAALDPDLVILAFDFQGEVETLTTLAIPHLLLGPPPTWEGALDQLRTIGAATGHRAAATELADRLAAELDQLVPATPPAAVTMFHEVDNTLYSATSATFLGDLYSRFGYVNIADAVDDGSGFPQLSAEYVFEHDPQVIFLADATFGESIATVAARPGWDELAAVKNGLVVELDGDVAGRWGPRTVELAAQMAETLSVALEQDPQ